MKLKHALAAIFLILSFAAPVAAGPLEDASVAYSRGDYATVLRLMRPLADQGDAVAQHNLGVIYGNGLGVPQNYAEAVKWYRLAAEQGYGPSQFNLGLLYDKGRGVSQNDVEAVKWYGLAANQSNATAQVNLGVLYAQGRGVKQDYVRALMWFNLSAAQGEQRAVTGRDMAAQRMTSAQIAEAQKLAREWRPTTANASPAEITPRSDPFENFDPFSFKPKVNGTPAIAAPATPAAGHSDFDNFDWQQGTPGENKTSLLGAAEGFGGLVLIAILLESAYWKFRRYATGSNPLSPQVARSAPVWSLMLATKAWLKERYDQAPGGELKKFHDRAAHRAQNLQVMKPETLKRIRTLQIILTAAFILGGGGFAVQSTLNPQPYDYQARIDVEVHPIASIFGALLPYIILAPFAYWFSGGAARRITRRYEARYKVCEYCAETIKSAAKVCRYCGRDVTEHGPSTDSRG